MSFEAPEYTADVDALGTLRLLEAIRFLGLGSKTRFYQASTSELYGLVQEVPQRETTPFHPRSPYAVAKLYATGSPSITARPMASMPATASSSTTRAPRRGETFVTRKITRGLANIAQGLEDCLYMGNIDALRDWGHAKDYVADAVADAAAGPRRGLRHRHRASSTRSAQFITWAARSLASGSASRARVSTEHAIVEAVTSDAAPRREARPGHHADRSALLPARRGRNPAGRSHQGQGEARLAAQITARELCAEMVAADLKSARRHRLLKEHGLAMPVAHRALRGTRRMRIFLAGHQGMVGGAILRSSRRRGAYRHHPRPPGARPHQPGGRALLHAGRTPDVVILAAAKVGGILANNTYPADFIYENLMIEANVIHQAFAAGVRRLLFLGSSCIYPRDAAQPMREDALLTGPLEATNEPYAIAKIAGIKLCESYNRQYGVDYRSVMPTNLYGPGDNFHPENAHVLPALMRRFHEAAQAGADEVVDLGHRARRGGSSCMSTTWRRPASSCST